MNWVNHCQSQEMEAAKELKDRLEEGLSSIEGNIWIIPSVDIHPATGRHDVDLIMIGHLKDYYVDQICGLHDIEIRNFFTTIEIKSHSACGIMRDGTHLKVKYGNEWENVTIQSEDQKNSIRRFLEGPLKQSGIRVPFISNLIWLQGIGYDDFTETIGLTDSNVLVSDSSAEEFFKAIGRQSRLRDNGFVQGFGNATEDEIKLVADLFCSKCDGADTMSLRRINIMKKGSMERDIINKLHNQQEQMVVLAGHAGTGKTIMLLQTAVYLSRNGNKCLFLTYNTALIADLKHTMQILNSPVSSLEMQSMHSFMIGLLRRTGIWRNSYDIEKDFEYAITSLLQTKDNHPINYDYEYVFVDEAQDWKNSEAELLKHYCKNAHIVIADGVDQFMYSSEHTYWGDLSFPKLKSNLRQRANLAIFAKKFASKLGIFWDVDPSSNIPGGRVFVAYQYTPDLHKNLYEDTKEHGCTAYDLMLLAPNSLVEDEHFKLRDKYHEKGIHIYDGIDKKTRDSIYSIENYKNEECRVFTYESCRGLEAWTTVCLRFDELFSESHPHDYHELKYKAAKQYMLGLWSLIPLTRAVDTLVLCITKGSFVDTVLKEIAEESPDYVKYI